MSLVKVEDMRAYLRVIHTSDDPLIQRLIDGAEDEALQYMDRKELPRRNETAVDECDSNTPEVVSDSDDLAPSVRAGIYMIVQAQYEGLSADDVQKFRAAAEVKWTPYRNQWGV